MTSQLKFSLIILLSILILFCFSCKDKNKDEKAGDQNKLTESVLSADLGTFKKAQEQFDVFFKYLKTADYKNCVNLFKAELLKSPGEDALIGGLTNRNASMGAPENFKIIYDYVDYPNNSDTVFYFIIRSFNKQGGMCYERIGMENVANDLFIGLYEYSPVPYCDVKMANDVRSEVYKANKVLYDLLNLKEYEKAVDMVDKSVIESQGKDKLVKLVTEQSKNYKKINTFRVTSVNVQLESEIIKINLVIEVEDVDKNVFVEDLIYVDRGGILKIVTYKRREKIDENAPTKQQLSNDDYGRFKKEIGNFYQNLGSNNIDAIMTKIDKSVFQNNDFNTVKTSFANRNSYYGTPQDTKIISHEVKSIDGMTIVEFYCDITNSNGIKSYEKVSISYSSKTDFLLYGYDYSDKPMK